MSNKNFDWKTYVDNYEDLRNAGINTKESALQHWYDSGRQEGRTDKIKEQYLLHQVKLDDIHIYDIDVKWGFSGYNIGDLLNMPYYWAGWKQNPHTDENILNTAKNTATNNNDSILGRYYSSRNDDSEKIPNISRLNNILEQYIYDKSFKKQNIYNLINNDNILVVHVRSGDYGIISDNYVNIIYQLSLNFFKVILLSGVNRTCDHTNENSEININKRKNLLCSLNKILEKNTNIYVYIAEPDYHIAIMHLCKNLLVHRGGYSIIGTFVCNGNIYYTNELQCNKNLEWINEMKNKKLIKID